MPKKYLSVKEVARLLSVTPLTVRNWDNRGKLRAHRHPMNNYRLYKVEDVEELMRELDISKVARKISNTPPSDRRELIEPEKPQAKRLKIDIL